MNYTVYKVASTTTNVIPYAEFKLLKDQHDELVRVLNNIQNALATNDRGDNLTAVARSAARAELALFRYEATARKRGYSNLEDALSSAAAI